eukprot:CAMPEP_0195003080 /NCGR_PEP_ID=MMETSP0326_2-20130528/3240_1 /TAXON_ID=2866 ORGANISM="Crypthecodinium cohnii, Strain Seligo" /NCGR_SAMPLE_ID=MMETSP0326_2 /ASSEMBLY_ACC=CAM_ASM_000348 /LENGTH=61 /DNA_ID=CAMNT_0040007209 /DNA_START=505 /DNA_END=691 /DNA_ORIENTATION=+
MTPPPRSLQRDPDPAEAAAGLDVQLSGAEFDEDSASMPPPQPRNSELYGEGNVCLTPTEAA